MEEQLDFLNKKKPKKEEGNRKALFFQRFVAFLIDAFLVSIVASLLATPFVDTDKEEKYTSEALEVVQQYSSQKISLKEYTDSYISYSYQLARVSGATSIISIFISVLYFVVFQIKKKGQTIGKKLMKIRVVSTDGELFYNQMIFRSMIANSILVKMITFMFMLFNSATVYFYSSMLLEAVQDIIIIISVIMVMNKNNGLAIHDKLVHTMVIRED